MCAAALGEAIGRHGYTCWACAVCSNHAHLVIRVHRDKDDVIWETLRDATTQALREHLRLGTAYPVWAQRPWAKFLDTPEAVGACVEYVEGNPEKEGLPPQVWPFVRPYDGWPYHPQNRGPG
mgnify:FL=1